MKAFAASTDQLGCVVLSMSYSPANGKGSNYMVAFFEVLNRTAYFGNNSCAFVATDVSRQHVVLGMTSISMQFTVAVELGAVLSIYNEQINLPSQRAADVVFTITSVSLTIFGTSLVRMTSLLLQDGEQTWSFLQPHIEWPMEDESLHCFGQRHFIDAVNCTLR